jgi:hypothetical protein
MNKLTLELTIDEINTILAGLGELPAKASIGTIEKIRMQVIPQVQAQQAAAPEAMPGIRVEDVPAAE